MAALIGLDFAQASAIAAQAASDFDPSGAVCQAANDNGGGQVVISGTRAAVERAIELAKAAGAKRALALPVSAPFHCALMRPAADAMATALTSVAIKAPRPPLVANASATAIEDPATIRASLVAQVTGAVRWRESILYMVREGVGNLSSLAPARCSAG